jgi:hypothetical protein
MVMSRRTRFVFLAVIAAVGAGAISWTSAQRLSPRAAKGPVDASKGVLHVPRVAAPIPINAETEGKRDWEGERGKTPNFVDGSGKGMVPYTEARLRWDSGRLYLLLYAGDLDLEGSIQEHDGPVQHDDSFRLDFRTGSQVRVIDVSLLGTVADRICSGVAAEERCDPSWESHAEVAVDRDGTMNKIGDNDEEWVVEMAIPFASLGIAAPAPGARLPFSVSRCEVGHGPHSCGGWGSGAPPGEIELDP